VTNLNHFLICCTLRVECWTSVNATSQQPYVCALPHHCALLILLCVLAVASPPPGAYPQDPHQPGFEPEKPGYEPTAGMQGKPPY
jgi:hypothetical protein